MLPECKRPKSTVITANSFQQSTKVAAFRRWDLNVMALNSIQHMAQCPATLRNQTGALQTLAKHLAKLGINSGQAPDSSGDQPADLAKLCPADMGAAAQ